MGCFSSKASDDNTDVEVDDQDSKANLTKDFVILIRDELNDVRNSRQFSPTTYVKKRLIDLSVCLLLLIILALAWYKVIGNPTSGLTDSIGTQGADFNKNFGEFKDTLAKRGADFNKTFGEFKDTLAKQGRRFRRQITKGAKQTRKFVEEEGERYRKFGKESLGTVQKQGEQFREKIDKFRADTTSVLKEQRDTLNEYVGVAKGYVDPVVQNAKWMKSQAESAGAAMKTGVGYAYAPLQLAGHHAGKGYNCVKSALGYGDNAAGDDGDQEKVKPAETKPVKVDSEKVDSTEVDPAEVKPAETKPVKVDSTEVKPAEVKPA
eukprot:698985_1